MDIYDKHIMHALSQRCLRTQCLGACPGLKYRKGKEKWYGKNAID